MNVSERDQQNNPSAQGAAQAPVGDWFLQALLHWVEEEDRSMGITLTVGGVVVSGYLISSKEFLKLFREQFMGGLGSGDKIKKDAEGLFSSLGDGYPIPCLGVEQKWPDEAKERAIEYIHLREAQFYVPGNRPLPADFGVLWRARLSAVDGFLFGKLD